MSPSFTYREKIALFLLSFGLLISCRARADVLMTDDFESYAVGTWPSANWVADANAINDPSNNQIVNLPGGRTGQSLKLFGQIGGCWAAIGYHQLTPPAAFDLEFDVYNGSETLSGCHPGRAQVELKQGTHWYNYTRVLVAFWGDGNINNGGDVVLGQFQTLQWYHVKISYRRSGNQLALSYWLDGKSLGTVNTTIADTSQEDSLDHLDLTAEEGSVWFDNILVTECATALWSDDFSTDTTASYNTIYWPWDGASATTSILYDALNQRAIVQGVGGYGNIVMEKNGESPIPAGSDFTFSADVSVLSEFTGYLYLGDNRPITPFGGAGTGLKLNIGTYMSHNCYLEIYQSGVTITNLITPITLQSSNNLRINRVGNVYSFYCNDVLFWQQTIPTLDGMDLYWGAGSAISSGPCCITARTAVDNIRVMTSGGCAVDRNPVIIVPGVGGSELDAPSGSAYEGHGWPNDCLRPGLSCAVSPNPTDLQFNGNGQPANGVSSSMVATKFLTKACGFEVYEIDHLVQYLEGNGYSEGCTLFRFPYDFRYSIRDLGSTLAATVDVVRAATGASKVDIVAHSMGCLVTKQCLGTAGIDQKVGTAVLLAPPNLGAPKMLAILRYGDFLGLWASLWMPDYPIKRVAHNLPAAFNLLPSEGYFTKNGGGYFVDGTDLDHDGKTGLLSYQDMLTNLKNGVEDILPLTSADPAPIDRLSSSLVDSELVQFQTQLDQWQKPTGVKVFVVAGYGASTPVKIWEDNSSGYAQQLYGYATEGDGTVPLISAENLSLKTGVAPDGLYYAGLKALNADHGSLLGKPDIQKQVAGLLKGGAGIYGNNISTTRPSSFSKTTTFTVYSPVRLQVLDSQGNESGFTDDISYDSNIPGSAVARFGEVQAVTVTEGDVYTVTLLGLDTGSFTLQQSDADDHGDPSRTIKWIGVPVKTGSVAQVTTTYGAVDPVLKVDLDGNGTWDIQLLPDSDQDGVSDGKDLCPDTPPGSIVNSNGCSIAQLVPCAGPLSGGAWKNHGEYLFNVIKTATDFLKANLITRRQWADIVTRAARSKCGWNPRQDHGWDRDWNRDWDCDRDRDWGRNRDWGR